MDDEPIPVPKATPEPSGSVSADDIAEMADRGDDISRFFRDSGKMMPPVQQRKMIDHAE